MWELHWVFSSGPEENCEKLLQLKRGCFLIHSFLSRDNDKQSLKQSLWCPGSALAAMCSTSDSYCSTAPRHNIQEEPAQSATMLYFAIVSENLISLKKKWKSFLFVSITTCCAICCFLFLGASQLASSSGACFHGSSGTCSWTPAVLCPGAALAGSPCFQGKVASFLCATQSISMSFHWPVLWG